MLAYVCIRGTGCIIIPEACSICAALDPGGKTIDERLLEWCCLCGLQKADLNIVEPNDSFFGFFSSWLPALFWHQGGREAWFLSW